MTIRTKLGLAHMTDVREALGDDWEVFNARFPRCTEHGTADSPGFCIPCRYVYEWWGLKNVRVDYKDGVITLTPNQEESTTLDNVNV